MAGRSTLLNELADAIRKACHCTHAGLILTGRREVLALPREWTITNFEPVAAEVLDLSDSWEYRRLLELAELLDSELVQKIVLMGLTSTDSDVREAAEDFSARLTAS